ncbi:MAG: hypothetical protein ACKO7N_05250 [Candidatus Nitrosotenuis sp.]
MGETIEIRCFTAGKKYRYLIRNLQSLDIQLSTPISVVAMPESNDGNAVLTKAEGNTMRFNVSWVIHDESVATVLTNPYNENGGNDGDGSTVVDYAGDSGFKKADNQVKFLLNPQGLNNTSAFQCNSLIDKYQIIIGETGFSRVGLLENIQITKQGSSPVTWNASLSFVSGLNFAI